jgi:hypothetical protein
MRALLITADGDLQEVDYDGELSSLQGFVGGYVEAVRTTFGVLGWCDEEGLLKNKPWNPYAQGIFSDAGLMPGMPLVGDWLFTGEDGPDCAPLTDEQMTTLMRLVRAAALTVLVMGDELLPLWQHGREESDG